MENKNEIGTLVRQIENNYRNGTTTISKYVSFDLLENINKIDAYANSKHISGDKDSQGLDKPFFNIVVSAINIWYRATDIDRKNINIKPTKRQDVIKAFIANIKTKDWMKRSGFGKFLNEWGRNLAKYGSAVCKFVEKDGELIPRNISWNDIIVDAVDAESNPKIEILQLTPAQLRQRKGYDRDIVEKLIEANASRETMDGQKKDNKYGYIKLYEIHGELPLEYLTGKEEDSETYVQQMHVVSYVAGKEEGEYDDFCLVSGREDKDPYMITHLIKEDGRSQAIGAVEYLFEAQWMLNHSVKSIKDHLDLASKLIFATSDGNFIGQNALTSIANGDILVHAQNQPLTQVNNTSHDIVSSQNFGTMWKNLAQEITSTPDSLMGSTAPSGTAWRQVEALQQEAHSLFELMTENKGFYIEEMMRLFVIPFIKKQLVGNKDEIVGILEDHEISKIDSKFIKNKATEQTNKQVVDLAIKALETDTQVNPEAQAILQSENEKQLQDFLNETGNTRFFTPSEISSKTWDEVLKDLEWEVEVDVTGEAAFNKEDLATLSTVLQTIATNPMILQDPNAKLLFNKILTITGTVSPAELKQPTAQPTEPVVPAQ